MCKQKTDNLRHSFHLQTISGLHSGREKSKGRWGWVGWGWKAIERNGGSVSVILMGWWWQLQSSFTTCTNTDGENNLWKFRVDKSSAKVRLRLDDGGCWKSSEKLIKVHPDLGTSRGRRMLQEILGFYFREHVNAKKRNGLGTLRTTPIYDTQFWRTKKKKEKKNCVFLTKICFRHRPFKLSSDASSEYSNNISRFTRFKQTEMK